MVGDCGAPRPPLGIVRHFGWRTGGDGKKTSVLVLTQDGQTAPLGTLPRTVLAVGEEEHWARKRGSQCEGERVMEVERWRSPSGVGDQARVFSY